MKFRHIAVAALAVTAISALPAQAGQITGPQDCVGSPADPAEWQLAIEVVQVIIPPNDGGAMMRGLMDAIGGQIEQAFPAPDDDPELKAIFDKRRAEVPDRIMPVIIKHIPSLSNAMACAYVAEFSLSELQELAAFSRTPTGRRYLSRSTALVADPTVAKANQAYFADVRPVAEAFFQDIMEDVKEYRSTKKR